MSGKGPARMGVYKALGVRKDLVCVRDEENSHKLGHRTRGRIVDVCLDFSDEFSSGCSGMTPEWVLGEVGTHAR